MKLFSGFNVSVQPCLMGNLMCIDLVSRVMQEKSCRQHMTELMALIRNGGGSKEQYQQRAKDLIVGSTVFCSYNQRVWRIDDIDFTKSMESTFTIEADSRPPREGKTEGKRERGNLGNFTGEITFYDYFTRRYPEILTKRLLPPAGHAAIKVPGLLVNAPKKARTTLKTTILLPELCYLTGLNDAMRANQSLMKALNNETRLAPTKRVSAISDLMKKVHLKSAQEDKKKNETLPIQLGAAPVETKARILEDFKVLFPGNKSTTLSDNKSFATDIRNAGFFSGPGQPSVALGDFGCVHIANDDKNAGIIVQNIKKLAGQQGSSVGKCEVASVQVNDAKNAQAWTSAIQSLIAKRVRFIIICNPRADPFIYSVVKNVCAVSNSIVSQVIDTVKATENPKMTLPICGNTFKQIAAKMGLQNWRIDIAEHLPTSEKKSAMFVGVDVSHDKLMKGAYGQGRGRRSTVGFVASRNDSYHAYNSYISYQDPDTEFITDAKRLMKKALEDYATENKRMPTSVIVYRDGVGDSQLTTFVRSEIALYKEAFESLNLSNMKLVVIVVQKRVNLRLFTACPVFAQQAQRCPIEFKCSGRDKYHSPMCGTVVDNDITSQMLSDFYLVPSIAPPGATARPTRFIVMKDDIGFTRNADALQAMTNQMCYQYFNWPGPIRVPACVMYAHKIAYLFGKHVTGNPHAGLTPNLFFL